MDARESDEDEDNAVVDEVVLRASRRGSSVAQGRKHPFDDRFDHEDLQTLTDPSLGL